MNENKEKCLAIVILQTGGQYMANIVDVKGLGEAYSVLPMKERVIAAIVHDSVVVMNPAYDHSVPLMPTPGGGVSKRNFTTPLGMTMEPVPLYGKPGAVYFVDEMTKSDRASYEESFEDAARIAAGAKTVPADQDDRPLVLTPAMLAAAEEARRRGQRG